MTFPITDVTDSILPDAFVANLRAIFLNSSDRIDDALRKCSKDRLIALHKALCAQAQNTFAIFANRVAFNRYAPGPVIADILALGEALTGQSPTQNAERAFHPVPSNQTLPSSQADAGHKPTSTGDYLPLILALSDRVTALEAEVAALRNANIILPSAPTEAEILGTETTVQAQWTCQEAESQIETPLNEPTANEASADETASNETTHEEIELETENHIPKTKEEATNY